MKGYNFIGIGKIMLNSQDTDEYNIPHLHFLMSERDGEKNAVNLEFGLVSTGTDEAQAIERLSEMLIEYIQRTVSTMSFDTFIDVVKSGAMNDFWTEYRVIEFMLAKAKKDLGHSMVNAIRKNVKQELLKKYGIEAEANFSSILGTGMAA